MPHTLKALTAHLHGRLIGDGSILIQDVNSLEAVREGELTFAEDARRLAQAFGTKASAIVVGDSVTELSGRAGISVHDPKLAFALLLDLFHPAPPAEGTVHPSAVVATSAKLGEHVTVRANAVIGERTRIGRKTVIEPGVYIGDDVTIGEDCLIGPNVTVYRQTILGARVRIHGGSVIGGDGFGYVFHEGRYVKVPQVGNVVIEDDVEIGCNSCVDRSTIGSTLIQCGTKIDNLVQVAHNNRIGRHVILAGKVGLAGSVSIGDYALLGGHVVVSDHVDIGEQAKFGIGTLVVQSVPAGANLWGVPARPANEVKRQLVALSRLTKLLGPLLRLVKHSS